MIFLGLNPLEPNNKPDIEQKSNGSRNYQLPFSPCSTCKFHAFSYFEIGAMMELFGLKKKNERSLLQHNHPAGLDTSFICASHCSSDHTKTHDKSKDKTNQGRPGKVN